MSPPNDPHILTAGYSCWRISEAPKASFLVDAEAYFHAFREAAKLAQKSIFICGWDIDSRLALLREDPKDNYPIHLREFLNTLADKKKGLQIYILIWDFAMLIGLDREWFPLYKLDWKTHRSIQLAMDDLHPVGASQHQKIIVIDDVLAFVGGLDLTKNRWDTPEHNPEDERRKNPDGEFYRPHHDVQMMVAGKTATDLGEFFRQRWKLVTGDRIAAAPDSLIDPPWPEQIKPDVYNCDVGIARTIAQFRGSPAVREVEKLYLDTIEKAEKYILIENQYLTSPKISHALAGSLKKKNGPEVIIVLPLTTDGWISQQIMDQLRYRALQEMRQADEYGRLGVFYAHQDGLQDEDSIKIHSKLMVADDNLVRIGSSNLNNRSMGLDTECDLAVETYRNPDQQKAVADFCSKLLAEHLGVDKDSFQKSLKETGSRLKTIQQLQGNERTLKILAPQIDESVELVAMHQDLLDPEEPIEPERFIEHWLPVNKLEKSGFKKGPLMVFVAAILMGLLWRFTPLNNVVSGRHLAGIADALKSNNLAWLYILGAYTIGSILIVPITVLITLTLLIYGSFQGAVFAILGVTVSCAITYWLGRIMGRETIRRLAGNTLNKLSRRLGKRGILSTFIIRLIPVAPYSIVNMVAGASHIRFFDFMVGTILGMLPGIFAIVGLVDRGTALITNPSAATVISLFAVMAIIGAGAFFIKKKLVNRE